VKVGIVGCGFVGSAAAYAMAFRGTAREIVLVDPNRHSGEGQVDDLVEALPFFNPLRVVAGDFPLLANVQVVILACGVGQLPGEARISFLKRNLDVFKKIVPLVLQFAPEAVLLNVSNPVDIMTQAVTKISGINPARILGSGTIVETGRFGALLGEHLGVAPASVQAYVLGEHGPSEVLVWSGAKVGGLSIQDYAKQMGVGLTDERKSEIDQGVRRATSRILGNKGETCYAIGAAIAQIVHTIRDDERRVLTVSGFTTAVEGFKGISLSLPRVLGAKGISTEFRPDLSTDERLALNKSADLLKEAAVALNMI
jgi:L-lactate dehydrogenase